jgi:hypothetical protein
MIQDSLNDRADVDVDFRDLGGSSRHAARARRFMPRGPKKFRVEKAGTGVRAVIADYGPDSTEQVGSGAVSYLVYWAENVDMTTAAGIANGFARATLLAPGIPATGKEDGEASAFFADPKYQTGYFYCIGVDGKGNRSEAGVPVHIQSGTGGTVPPDVEHFLSIRIRRAAQPHDDQRGLVFVPIPANGAGIDRVQFYFKNYPNYGQLSEGQSVRIDGRRSGLRPARFDLPVGRSGVGTVSERLQAPRSRPCRRRNELPAQAQLGDKFEVFGVRALDRYRDHGDRDDALHACRMDRAGSCGRGGLVVFSTTTIYAVSVGVDGARRDDVTNAPSRP